jgi:hypothetical protein
MRGGHAFSWRQVLRGGPAPLTLVSLGRSPINCGSMLCAHCNTPAAILASAHTRHTPQVDVAVLLLKCGHCGELSLIEEVDDGSRQTFSVRLYPVSEKSRNILPSELRRSYDEAIRCFQAECYLASVILCRRALELVCRYHQSTTGTLFSRIRKLHAEHIINDALFDLAESVRTSGNLAAHDPKFDPAAGATAEFLGFTGATIHFIYSAITANKGWCIRCGGNFSGSEISECLLCGQPLDLGSAT